MIESPSDYIMAKMHRMITCRLFLGMGYAVKNYQYSAVQDFFVDPSKRHISEFLELLKDPRKVRMINLCVVVWPVDIEV